LTVIRDTASFILAWYLMIYQAQFAEKFEWVAFVGGMVLSGVPSAVQAVPLFLGRGIAGPSPPLEPEPSAPESVS